MPLPASGLAHHADDQAIVEKVDDLHLEVASACLAQYFLAEHLVSSLISIDLLNKIISDGVFVDVGVWTIDADLNFLSKQIFLASWIGNQVIFAFLK